MKKRLYWVTTPCGREDWFVVARSQKYARQWHESAEGFGENYATAKCVCSIPKDIEDKYYKGEYDGKENWPSHELLEALGLEFIYTESPRKLKRNGQIYYEGRSIDACLLDYSSNKTGVYVFKVQETDLYKIGYSKNIKRRFHEFQRTVPYNMELVLFLEAPSHYRSHEKHIHEVYKEHLIGNEWFKFSNKVVDDLEYRLAFMAHHTKTMFGSAKQVRRINRG